MSRGVTMTLPYPPSLNTYWRQFQGRLILSAKGREYRQAAVSYALVARATECNGRLAVTMRAYMPDNRRRDIDNIFKAVGDALTHAGVWKDDEQIDDLRIIRAGVDKLSPRVEITIEPLSA